MELREGLQTRPARVDFPKYKGGDPIEWLDRVEMFFQFQGTPYYLWVQMAAFHLEGQAYQWLTWWRKKVPFPNWEEFGAALCARFGPTEYEDFDRKFESPKTVRHGGGLQG